MKKRLLFALFLLLSGSTWAQDFHIVSGSTRVSYDAASASLCCTYSIRNSGIATTQPVIIGIALAPGNNSGTPAGTDPNAQLYVLGYDTLRGFAANDTVNNRQYFARLANFCNIPAGNYAVLVLLDYPNRFPEADETYNRIRLGNVNHTCQTVAPGQNHSTKPDILFEAESGLLSHDLNTGELTFTTAIRNSGGPVNQTFKIAYVLAVNTSAGSQHFVLGTETISGMNAGQVLQSLRFQTLLSNHCNIPPGTYRFMLMTDYGNQLAESDEINNNAGFNTIEVRPCSR